MWKAYWSPTDWKIYKKCKSLVFKKDEKVLVWLRTKGGNSALKRRFVVEGKVIKKSKKTENYKVSLVRTRKTVQIKLWIGIEDITGKRTKRICTPARDYFRSIRWQKLQIYCNSIFPSFILLWVQCKPTPWRSSWLSKNT